MKINDLNTSALNGLSTGSISSGGIAGYGRNGRAAYGSSPDQIQLSSASRVAYSAIAAHAGRLQELKRLIAAGKYDPPGEVIGKSLVKEALLRSS